MHTRREFLRCVSSAAAMSFGGGAVAAQHDTTAIQRAVAYLKNRQSPDGAWRSDVYGAFREGDALTPLVIWALPQNLRGPKNRALAWLHHLTAQHFRQAEPWNGLRYPLFTASYAAQFFAANGDLTRARLWADLVLKLQIPDALNPKPSLGGGWSDSPVPPAPLAGQAGTAPDMLAPNLSATVLGMQAVRAARRSHDLLRALSFVIQCQNFVSTPAAGRESPFDDGGFFFALEDPIRSKAGAAGTDPSGRQRLRSYGSATCDGYLALRASGLAEDHPRVEAALGWLRIHCNGLEHSGAWPTERTDAAEALTYYYAAGLGRVLTDPFVSPGLETWRRQQQRALRRDLLARQAHDGSWCGSAPESCEDDPLLATALALRALLAVNE